MTKELRKRIRSRNGSSSASQPSVSKSETTNVSKQPKAKVGICVKVCVTGALVVIVSLVTFYRYQSFLRNIVVTPMNSPKILAANSSSATENPDRFWGTYRSQTYFGLKTRTPKSPVVGLMWLPQFTGKMPPPVRHWCDQADKIKKYGWTAHDGIYFGIQEIEEAKFTLKTEFVKRPGGLHGGDWTAKFTVKPKVFKTPQVVSLMFYIALEGEGQLDTASNKKRLTAIKGFTEELGTFEIKFPKSVSSNQKFHHLITHANHLDELKDVLMQSMSIDNWEKSNDLPYFIFNGRYVPKDTKANYIVHQVTAVLPLQMEVIFESESFHERPNTLSGDVFTTELHKYQSHFDAKFERLFPLHKKGYGGEEISFAKAALSNMIGSIGYFYGSSLVQSAFTEEPVAYWEAPLYTGVPSRPFFPRGFLWDEGFHNLLISHWDENISVDIIAHWFDLMNIEGWIPREQILGVEAQAKVPTEFVVQKNKNANPPTFFLPLKNIIKNMIKSNRVKDKAFLNALYPRLKAWFSWYNTSQVGSKPSVYRWRGRDSKTNRQLNPLTLTSGLDDFPRASHPSEDEFHIDLRCWMALASGVMADIARSLDKNWRQYDTTHRQLTDNALLDKLHWSDKGQQYSDYGLHTEQVKLIRPKRPTNLPPGQKLPPQEKVRVTRGEPKLQHVDSLGYVSLFPFLLKIVDPKSPKLYKILRDLKDPSFLWSDFGIRSLSWSAKLYNSYNTEHDPPYWRGAIWINMNYLALAALDYYSKQSGPYQETAGLIYNELRSNVVGNMIREYQRTGYIWENYSDNSGQGKGSHPFTGWSALVVLIMGEKY